MKGRRQERAASQVRAAISELLLREVKDPRLRSLLVSRVEMSADLKHARVFIIASGGESERARALSGLRRAQGFIRSQVSRLVGLRFAPEIKFILDHAIDDATRVEQLLKEAVSTAEGTGDNNDEQR